MAKSKEQSFADKYRGGKGVVDKKPAKANEAASKRDKKDGPKIESYSPRIADPNLIKQAQEIGMLKDQSGGRDSGGGDSGGGGISSDVLSTALGFVNPGLGIFAKYGGPLIETILKNSKSLFGDRPVGEDIYQKLIDGEELTQDERIKLIDLQKKLNKEEGFNEFSFDDDSTYLNREIGNSTIGDLLSNSGIVDEGLLKELISQRYNNQDLIDDQDNLGFKKTIQQGLGFNMPEGYLSQTDAMKQLGPEQLAALQRIYPETYYGDDDLGFKPRSQRELEDLAAMDISAAKGNEGLVREIARARDTLRREGREGQAAPLGLAALAPTPTVTTGPTPYNATIYSNNTTGNTTNNATGNTTNNATGNTTNNATAFSPYASTANYKSLGIPQVVPNAPGGFSGAFPGYYDYLTKYFGR
jgi:hypothetical protein